MSAATLTLQRCSAKAEIKASARILAGNQQFAADLRSKPGTSFHANVEAERIVGLSEAVLAQAVANYLRMV